MKSILWWFILFVIIAKLFGFIYINRNYFLRKFDPSYFGSLYSQSQYVLGPLSKGGIGDDGLYAFAGYYYLFQKGDISSVNFEHPPLGKYLIGLSILLFGNENVINIIYFLLLLLVTYRFGLIILKNKLESLISVLLLSIDPLFLDNLLRSLLDLPFTLFFMLGVYFFLLGLRSIKYLCLSMFFWGVAFSTRFFPSLFLIYSSMLFIFFCYYQRKLIHFVIASFLIPGVYFISHISFFSYHPSLIEFLKHKRWMLSWFSGSIVNVGNIWRNIFTGYYVDSTGILVSNQYWTQLIPIIIILAITRWRRSLLNQKNFDLIFVYILSVMYLIYVTFLTGGLQKFIMPVYPLLTILAISNFTSGYSIMIACKKRILARSKIRL